MRDTGRGIKRRRGRGTKTVRLGEGEREEE